MPYIQNSDADREAMLAEVGVGSVRELFDSLPQDQLLDRDLAIDPGLNEEQLQRHLANLGAENTPAAGACFLGGGFYDHAWPALVDHLMQRTEFLTSYTPYQPECSQGTLQWIYEFQTMIADLCGCEVANASMYDGASAAAEAALMAMNATGRSKVVVSAGMHPHARATIMTYLKHIDAEVVEAPLKNGVTDWGDLVDDQTAAVMVQQPNYLGNVESMAPVVAIAKAVKAYSVASIYPVSMGLLKSPGEQGFDIVVGDGQSLGVPLGYGGPSFGFFAASLKAVRKLPGRLVGISEDTEGKRAFTLAFQTREQHIRREKATSNICTNNALIALRGCMHMAALGPEGLEEVACVSRQRALEMVGILKQAGFSRAFPDAAFFNEVAFRADSEDQVLQFKRALKDEGLFGVIPMGRDYPGMEDVFTMACTERTLPEDLIRLGRIAATVLQQEVAR
ncbi:MAG: aminomethyl-transferring glycine dehydrogenase subunit GcvPA [Planctomycetota bacterium]|nr:aminomethyl-transferring glycine dehydrogenase subunit GcvPA [Planctomycetota bacterium]MDA1113570.1 aminomethyl-transferring glycine dehydrogenase subunit GcvPA [Planctomycetota bacterium]